MRAVLERERVEALQTIAVARIDAAQIALEVLVGDQVQEVSDALVVGAFADEPLGGAHRDAYQTAARLKQFLLRTLRELTPLAKDKLLAARYEKFRRMGVFLEEATAQA